MIYNQAQFVNYLFTYYLYQNPLFAPAIELTVEYLFPRPEVEPAVSNRRNDLAAHDRPLQVGVSVIFSCQVVPVLLFSIWSKLFKPSAEILM